MIRTIMVASLFFAAPSFADLPAPLKPGPDLDVVTASCATCHTLNYIRMNSPFLTPDAWKAEVTKMQKVYGAPIDDETVASIVKYLAATYAVPPKP